jgi:DNA-binding PadR family transcriptional regulator
MIQELARHGYTLSPGTLYPMLHGLERRGYLKSTIKRSGRTFRRLYRATALGRDEQAGQAASSRAYRRTATVTSPQAIALASAVAEKKSVEQWLRHGDLCSLRLYRAPSSSAGVEAVDVYVRQSQVIWLQQERIVVHGAPGLLWHGHGERAAVRKLRKKLRSRTWPPEGLLITNLLIGRAWKNPPQPQRTVWRGLHQ